MTAMLRTRINKIDGTPVYKMELYFRILEAA